MESYFVPAEPASYSGAAGFAREYRKKVGASTAISTAVSSSSKEIKNWLSGQDAYTLHKQSVKKFPRRKTVAMGINHCWQCDLVEVQEYAADNDNVKYLLTSIDVFSKKARVSTMINKTGIEVARAFSKMISGDVQKPLNLQSDKGREFLSAPFQRLLEAENIHHYTSENEDIKASIIERFHRTLRGKMFRYFTHNNTRRYVDVLDDLVESYNRTRHSTIKMAPNAVSAKNEKQVYKTLYGKRMMKKMKFKFSIGDSVRILESKRTFHRGYLPKWSLEIYTIKRLHSTNPPTYSIQDYNGEIIRGRFYVNELQKIQPKTVQDYYKIDKVLKTRGKGNKKQYLVSWKGYDSSFNSWVLHNQLKSIK